uniref:Uncharacterized protein n=1 Tax=Oryza glumipatula TaxID=40148 RepID=A0A0D9YYY6_9ORYZ
MEYMRLVVDLMVKRGRPKLHDGVRLPRLRRDEGRVREATFGDGILAKPQPEDGKMSIFSIIWAVKEDLESTAHDTMGPLSVLSSGNRTQAFLWETGKKMLEPAAISLNKVYWWIHFIPLYDHANCLRYFLIYNNCWAICHLYIVLNHYMENGTPTFAASLQQINAARASFCLPMDKSPPTADFSPLPTYRHLSSHSPAPAHRVGKPRRAVVEELLGRRGDKLPGGTGRCLSVNPSTTPPPLEIRHWGDGRRRRDPRAVVAGHGCGHRRADGREARSWRAAVAVVDGLMGGRSATAAVAPSWWAPDDGHACRHGSLFL